MKPQDPTVLESATSALRTSIRCQRQSPQSLKFFKSQDVYIAGILFANTITKDWSSENIAAMGVEHFVVSLGIQHT